MTNKLKDKRGEVVWLHERGYTLKLRGDQVEYRMTLEKNRGDIWHDPSVGDHIWMGVTEDTKGTWWANEIKLLPNASAQPTTPDDIPFEADGLTQFVRSEPMPEPDPKPYATKDESIRRAVHIKAAVDLTNGFGFDNWNTKVAAALYAFDEFENHIG